MTRIRVPNSQLTDYKAINTPIFRGHYLSGFRSKPAPLASPPVQVSVWSFVKTDMTNEFCASHTVIIVGSFIDPVVKSSV